MIQLPSTNSPTATTHLIKLCVGIKSVDQLIEYRQRREAQGLGRADGLTVHRTRMMPTRGEQIEGRGSLYWVINGAVRARQAIVSLKKAVDGEGRKCCDILMAPEIIRTAPYPKRPFQGWRYFRPEDAPVDMDSESSANDEQLAEELVKLGLL